MRVFVAGATGAIGTRLVPLLVDRGHEVVAMTRSRSKEDALREAGAQPVVADGLDRTAVVAAVSRAEPEVVVHEMTGLARLARIMVSATSSAYWNSVEPPNVIRNGTPSTAAAIATVGLLVIPWSRPAPNTVIGRRPTLWTPLSAR